MGKGASKKRVESQNGVDRIQTLLSQRDPLRMPDIETSVSILVSSGTEKLSSDCLGELFLLCCEYGHWEVGCYIGERCGVDVQDSHHKITLEGKGLRRGLSKMSAYIAYRLNPTSEVPDSITELFLIASYRCGDASWIRDVLEKIPNPATSAALFRLLVESIHIGDVGTITDLIARDCMLERHASESRPFEGALHHACTSLSLQTVATEESYKSIIGLLAQKCNVNATNSAGETSLYVSTREGNLSAVETLLQNGADPNIASRDGITCLSDAMSRSRGDIVELLLKHKADTNVSVRLDGVELSLPAVVYASMYGPISAAEALILNPRTHLVGIKVPPSASFGGSDFQAWVENGCRYIDWKEKSEVGTDGSTPPLARKSLQRRLSAALSERLAPEQTVGLESSNPSKDVKNRYVFADSDVKNEAES